VISKTISLGVLLIWVPVASLADDELGDEIGSEAPLSSPEWEETLDGLRSDSFLARETAAAALVALPKEALPWLDEKVAKAGGDDPEYTHRLASAAKLLRERLAEADLDNGLQVSLSMEDAKADAVFKAIQDIAPRPLVGSDARSPWADGVPKSYYGFEGSYWGAVDHLFEVFPPGSAADPGREKVDEEHDLLALGDGDFAAVNQPHASVGVLRVRAARTALENSNGKDYLTITMVPKLEPTYLPDEVALLLREVEFANGSKRLRRFERSGYQTATTFQPGRDFTWALPLDEGVDLGGPIDLDMKAQLKVRRMQWQERDLPKVGQAVNLGPSITLTLEESEEDYVKLKFEGESGSRIDFNQYTRHGMRRLFEIHDKEGNEVDFNIRSSSSGSGANDAWHQSYKCYFDDEEPASVRALIPGELVSRRLPLRIEDVPLPAVGK
jgi:hypothetical protein